jgi:signal transduction histidine kinase
MTTRHTLQRRVAWSAAGVAALVGLTAAAGTVTLMHRALRHADDRRLREAAQLFANEMGDTAEVIGPRANDEATELQPVGIRLAVFAGARRLGGASVQRRLSTGECSTEGAQRVCALQGAAGTVILTEAQASELPFEVLAMVAAAVALLASLGGLLGSRAIARWALEPLHALQRRLAAVDLDGQLVLGPPAATAEVEAFRQALTALVTRLREASERSYVFASSAAHELRTPLATISAELELAMTSPTAAPHEAMARALRSVQRLALLVDHVLMVARQEPGGRAQTETLAVEDLVRETIATRSTSERARITMHFDDPGMVRGDAMLLTAIVDNLADNALKYSGDGPVEIRVFAAQGQVALEVRDGGSGLSPEQFARLKQPFARGSQRAVAGHGLGLAIVHHAVELHRGEVSFDGPVVRVRLPAWTPSAAS